MSDLNGPQYLVIVAGRAYTFFDSAPVELAILNAIEAGMHVQLFGLTPLDIPTFLA